MHPDGARSPTRGRQLRLALALFGVFFTHIYRFPFAVALVFGITLVMYPATRKVKPVVAPVVAALTLYVLWTFVRQPGIPTDLGPLSLHFERLKQIPEFMFAAFTGPEELDGASEMLGAAVVLFALNALIFFLQRRQRDRTFRELWWGGAVTVLPTLIGVVFLGVYLTFPMSIGGWWFVFPREITTTAYISLAAVPDLPRQWWIRGPMLALIVLLTGRQALGTARQWDAFETSNADFRDIVKSIPRAPKLLYLVFDHSGSTRQVTPFIHMPAWVQAEKGGWLSFHFAIWGDVNPVRYRKGPSTPPPTPEITLGVDAGAFQARGERTVLRHVLGEKPHCSRCTLRARRLDSARGTPRQVVALPALARERAGLGGDALGRGPNP